MDTSMSSKNEITEWNNQRSKEYKNTQRHENIDIKKYDFTYQLKTLSNHTF